MGAHSHHHPHAHHDHHDHGVPHAGGTLRLAVVLTLVFACIEAVGGWWAHSLTLLGDAGHMFSDAIALAVSAFAAWLGKRPPSARHSYGLMRAEVVAAFGNGVVMLLVVIGILIEAVERLRSPAPVAGAVVMAIALAGLIINGAVIGVLSRGEKDLNVRGALLHVIGDLLGSVAALIAGAVIWYTGWTPIDPILSIAICALILYSTFGLLREALHVLMEGVPTHLDLNTVGQAMAQVRGVKSVHDLHIWMLSSGSAALSAHIVVADLKVWGPLLSEMRSMLEHRFHIDHVTLQPELGAPAEHAFSHVIPIQPSPR